MSIRIWIIGEKALPIIIYCAVKSSRHQLVFPYVCDILNPWGCIVKPLPHTNDFYITTESLDPIAITTLCSQYGVAVTATEIER
jgi:hypothetical protein